MLLSFTMLFPGEAWRAFRKELFLPQSLLLVFGPPFEVIQMFKEIRRL